ncbi:DmsE family decaheme c-type cytochrome [Thiovibrio sp. JS02]
MQENVFRQMRRYARTAALCLSAAGVLVLGGAATATSATDAGGACVGCHEQATASFNASYHARIWQGANGCQSCHGATDQHTAAPSQKTVISFSKDGGRSAEEMSAQCLSCHASTSSHLSLWDMGAHSRNDVGCISCHDIHTGRSTVKQPDICFTCHRDRRSDANKMSHHPIIEGKVKCSDCHNTHGSLAPGMIAAESINQLCYKCHADKRGPWIWEHPPVEENCAICHTPHGSRHENLMVEKIVNLCQNCHDDRRHHTSVNDGASTSHYVLKRGCLECHHSIHGSANFNRSFTR